MNNFQESVYENGEQTGPAKFTWPNGATRSTPANFFLALRIAALDWPKLVYLDWIIEP